MADLAKEVGAIRAARAERIEQYRKAAEERRLEQELLLAKIEAESGLMIGINMAVVWSPDGRACAVRKPAILDYEQFSREVSSDEGVSTQFLHTVVPKVLLAPTDPTAANQLFTDFPQVKELAMYASMNMCCAAVEKNRGK